MTAEDCIRQLGVLKSQPPDQAHRQADALLLIWLESNGHADIASAYRELAKSHGQK